MLGADVGMNFKKDQRAQLVCDKIVAFYLRIFFEMVCKICVNTRVDYLNKVGVCDCLLKLEVN